MNEQLYSISRAAGLVECPAQWLRDRDALLKPLKDQDGRRNYTDWHIKLAREMRQGMNAGVAA